MDTNDLSRVLWAVSEESALSANLCDGLARSIASGADWLLVPHDLPTHAVAALGGAIHGGAWSIVVGMAAHQLRARTSTALQDQLRELRIASCAAVLLQEVTTNDIKSGWPLHRLQHTRGAGLARSIFLDAPDYEAAEWMVENTPANAVSVPFGISDQRAKFRLFDVAAELGTAILASPPQSPSMPDPTEISYIVAESASSIILPLPAATAQLDLALNAIAHPMPEPQRLELWQQYQRHTPPPPKPRHGHAIDGE